MIDLNYKGRARNLLNKCDHLIHVSTRSIFCLR